ncbi:MAG: hypothetical protein H6624_05225 [Bdellovibrionaceae bacterium]|nr:hypothetical protein [Bdellovibrionales bacterium]MCB9083720.1 hypothetical protein [Pseudobdellovibrionaceae bacterium]
MREKIRDKMFRLYIFGISFVVTFAVGFLFTNAGDVGIVESGSRLVVSWLGSESVFSGVSETGPVCDNEAGAWVVLFDLEGRESGDTAEMEITKVDTGEKIDLGIQRLPATIGDCETPASGGQVKVCFESESGYEYRIDVDAEKKVSFIRELGCEGWPQKVRVAKLDQ